MPEIPKVRTGKKKLAGLVPVIAALLGNFCVAAMKFAGFLISGSSVLFSESVHSLADTLNQALLLVGIKRTEKRPDEQFIYGYGRERFFWALISACGIFFLGAGVTIYRGIDALVRHREIVIHPVVFGILGISFIIEAITFYLAFKELRRHNPGRTLMESLRKGDPSTLAVLFEDGIALCSIIVAAASLFLVFFTGKFFWDAVGSIIIGASLGAVAVILVDKNRGFLIGKTLPEELKERIIEILEADPVIEKVLDFKSSVLDVGVYRIKCEVEFNGPALLKDMRMHGFFKSEYEEIKDDYQEFLKFCVDYIDRVPRLIGERINKIEAKIKNEVPEIKHIDIEVN